MASLPSYECMFKLERNRHGHLATWYQVTFLIVVSTFSIPKQPAKLQGFSWLIIFETGRGGSTVLTYLAGKKMKTRRFGTGK